MTDAFDRPLDLTLEAEEDMARVTRSAHITVKPFESCQGGRDERFHPLRSDLQQSQLGTRLYRCTKPYPVYVYTAPIRVIAEGIPTDPFSALYDKRKWIRCHSIQSSDSVNKRKKTHKNLI